MARPQARSKFPTRKISGTFLDFAEPLLRMGAEAGEQKMKGVLQIAFTVWNAVVYDAVQGGSRWVGQVRSLVAETPDPGVLLLVEHMIARKRSLFGDDQPLIGEYKIVRRDGEVRLRAEAKSPDR